MHTSRLLSFAVGKCVAIHAVWPEMRKFANILHVFATFACVQRFELKDTRQVEWSWSQSQCQLALFDATTATKQRHHQRRRCQRRQQRRQHKRRRNGCKCPQKGVMWISDLRDSRVSSPLSNRRRISLATVPHNNN